MEQVEERLVAAERERASRLDVLYRTHATRAKRLAYLLTGDMEVAADVLHDAFVRVAGRFADLRDPDAFPAYLRRTVVSVVRSRHRSGVRESAHLRRHGPPPEIVEFDVTDAIDVRDALMSIGVRQRAAIVLRYYEDLSESQIADALRCRPGTVKSLLSRGLAALRTELSR